MGMDNSKIQQQQKMGMKPTSIPSKNQSFRSFPIQGVRQKRNKQIKSHSHRCFPHFILPPSNRTWTMNVYARKLRRTVMCYLSYVLNHSDTFGAIQIHTQTDRIWHYVFNESEKIRSTLDIKYVKWERGNFLVGRF